MTETGGGALIAASREPRHVGTRCIGFPPDDLDVRIEDETGELLVRQTGPIRGSGFFSGYYKDEAATEEAWRDGWFHTGDAVRRGPDGAAALRRPAQEHHPPLGREHRRAGGRGGARRASGDRSRSRSSPRPIPCGTRKSWPASCLTEKELLSRETAISIQDWCLERLAYFKAPGLRRLPRRAAGDLDQQGAEGQAGGLRGQSVQQLRPAGAQEAQMTRRKATKAWRWRCRSRCRTCAIRFAQRTGGWHGFSRSSCKQSGLKKADIDGLTVSSFTLQPDTAIGLTQHLGIVAALARPHPARRRERRGGAAPRGARGAGGRRERGRLPRRRHQPRRLLPPHARQFQPVRARRGLSLRRRRPERQLRLPHRALHARRAARRARTSASCASRSAPTRSSFRTRCSRSRCRMRGIPRRAADRRAAAPVRLRHAVRRAPKAFLVLSRKSGRKRLNLQFAQAAWNHRTAQCLRRRPDPDARRLGARPRRSLRPGRRWPDGHGFRADLRRLPGDLADAARGPRLLRRRTKARPSCASTASRTTARSRSTPRAASSRSARPARPAASSAWSRRSASSPAQAGGAAGEGRETRPRQRLRHDQLRPRPLLRRGDPSDAERPKAKESGPAHAPADAAAGGAQPGRARPHRGGGARALRAAAVPRLRHGAVPAAGGLPALPLGPSCLESQQSGEGELLARDRPAPQQRPVLPRAAALAPRPGQARLRADGRRPSA